MAMFVCVERTYEDSQKRYIFIPFDNKCASITHKDNMKEETATTSILNYTPIFQSL